MIFYVQDGETVCLKAEFRGFEGGHIDPDTITLKIWNSIKEVILEPTPIGSQHRMSAGIYIYEFPIPVGLRGQLVYEFKGYINGNPIIIRDIVEPVGIVDDIKHLTLYGD